MSIAASTLNSSTSHSRTRSQRLHWKTWVVPAIMLRDFIYEHQHVWQFRYAPPQHEVPGWDVGNSGRTNDNCGWRTYLSMEVAYTTRHSLETTQRNLYRVMSGEGQVINVDFAEAVVMSVDLNIDQDTNMPVLPGNLRNARELLEVRDPKFRKRSKEERLDLQRLVMEICAEIVTYPERLVELQDTAPFDCLRPPR